jgi:hypothetical protein
MANINLCYDTPIGTLKFKALRESQRCIGLEGRLLDKIISYLDKTRVKQK